MEFKDYYAILGVAPEADDKAIKVAYRKLARQYHPDVSQEANAEDRFKEVSEAYDVLHDKEKRAEYDQLRQLNARGQFQGAPNWGRQQASGDSYSHYSEGDFSDFFSSIFGGREHAFNSRGGFSERGQDVEITLPVFLEETLSNTEKNLEYDLPTASGVQRKKLKVALPTGVRDGQKIRLRGQGLTGVGDALAGDLYVNIKLVPHPVFDVDGDNLILTVPVAPWEAALGGKITVPTLDGDIRLAIPESSSTGSRLRVKGKGLRKKDGSRGDLLADIKIVMPKTLPEEARGYWQQLSSATDFDPRHQWR